MGSINFNRREHDIMSNLSLLWKDIGEVLAVLVGLFTVAFSITRICIWIKKRRQEAKDRRNIILDRIEKLYEGQKKLCSGQQDLYNRIDAMDEVRNKAREDDRIVRSNQYVGTMALISQMFVLANHLGLKINGDIQKYYEHSKEALKDGVGLYPLPLPYDKSQKSQKPDIDAELDNA